MSKLIDADALKATLRETLENYQYRPDDYGQGKAVGLTDAMEAVDWAPAVDAVPVVHGRWVISPDCPWPIRDCSVCGEQQISAYATQYCPQCGAKMDLEV